ncbi:MAG: hypothetical protein Q8R55_02575 [Candidatus Taylorbacteria bacterium]|nr:hypothetical protein [Candidatus Taylorbacteria bacterium]
MLLVATVAVILLVVLRYLPLKHTTLIEGVFDRKEDSSDFYEKVIAFWFDNQCRECIENNSENESLYGQCHTSVPATAINLDSEIEPQNGDSIKIIAWKTIFGRVMAYRFIRTNFVDEFAVQQLQKEDDEWRVYGDASDRREAMKRGLNLEEYRQVEKEESIQYAARQLELSPEEVVEHKYNELPQFMLPMIKKLVKELGRQPTREEISVEHKIDFDDMMERIRSTPVEDDECMEYNHLYEHRNLYNEYITTGTSSNQKLTEHLAECKKCLSDFTEMRERFLKSDSPDCLTFGELGTIRVSGLEPENRKDHISKCYHCRVLFRQYEEEHLSGQPGPECLTKDDLHTIHTTGEIPEVYKAHLVNCLRCQKAADKHRDAYINKVVPLPKLPKTRFKSIRAKYKKPTTN